MGDDLLDRVRDVDVAERHLIQATGPMTFQQSRQFAHALRNYRLMVQAYTYQSAHDAIAGAQDPEAALSIEMALPLALAAKARTERGISG